MALQIWLPLDGNLNNLGLNPMGFNPINSSSEGILTDINGKIGSCYKRSTSSAMRLRSSTTIDLNDDFSMVCWLCVDATNDTSAQGIVTNHDHNTHTGAGITLKQIGASDCRVSCNTGTGSSRTFNTYYGSTNIFGSWHHVGLTYSKSKKCLQLWVDGKVDYTLNNYSHASKADYIDIFGWSTGYVNANYTPLVRINDVRIYDHCLSHREMKELAKGLFLHYQLKNKTPITNLVKNAGYNIYNNQGVPATLVKLTETYQGCSIYRLTLTPTAAAVNSYKTELWSHGVYGFRQQFNANTKYCFWIYYRPVTHNDIRVGGTASNIAGWTEIAPHYYSDGWYRVGQYRNGAVAENKTDNIFTSFTCASAAADVPISIDFCCPHLIQEYDYIIEEDGYQIDSGELREADVSGYGRHGAMTALPEFTKDSPRHDGCYSIKTCQIYNYSLSTTAIKNSYTFAWWSKSPDMSGRMAWGFENGNRTNLYPSTYFCWNTGDGGNNPFQNSSGTGISFTSYQGNWHHYAITGNGVTTSLYIDGVLVGTAKTYKAIEGTKLVLSSWQVGTTNYRWDNGQLSDFRIYATCLDATDIKDLYNTPIEIDNQGNIFAIDFNEI